MDGIIRTSPSLIPSTTKNMTNTTLDKEIAAVPKFGDSISLFTKKLRLAQYADNSIYDYRLNIAQDEMKPILFLVAHFSKYLMRKNEATKQTFD